MTGVRIVLVGAGAIGAIVARAVYAAAPPDYRVVAVVDRQIERARALGLDVPAFAALSDVDVEYDAVDIRVPHRAHSAVALAALRDGRHVLVEKPLATSVADAAELVRMAAGGVVAVAENYPHLNAVRAARDAISSGAIGAVRAIRTTRAFTLDELWLGDGWRVADGILLDQGTHHTSLLRQLGGPIAAVSAHADPGPGGETVLLTVHFASGLIGQSLYSWGTPALEPDVEATVFGAGGRIDVQVAYESALGQARLFDGSTSTALSTGENYYDSHRSIVEDWVTAIVSGGQPVVSAADASTDLAVVLAGIQSLRDDGRTVELT